MTLTAFILAIALAQAPAPEANQELEGRIVSELSLELPEGMQRSDVQTLLVTAQGRPFSQAEADVDIRRLFASLPVRNVLVYAESDGELVRVRFALMPQIVVGRITVRGNDVLSREDILAEIDLKEGGEFRQASFEKVVPAVRRLYRDNGFFLAAVETKVVNLDEQTVTVRITVEEGDRARIGKVALAGVSADEFGWLAKAMDLESGDAYSQQKLKEAEQKLGEALAERGYREHEIQEPAITYDQAANRINVEQFVRPGPQVDFRFIGNRFFDDYDLYEVLGIGERVQMSPGDADDFSRQIRDLYQAWGFYQAQVNVEAANAQDRRVYTYRIVEGPQEFIRDVRFVGNTTLESERLYEAQNVRNRRFFDPVFGKNRGGFPEGMRAANDTAVIQEYRREGFLSAAIIGRDLRLDPNGKLSLQYSIREGPRTLVDAVILNGNQSLDEKTIRSALGVNPGVPFDQFAFDGGLERLRRLYRRNGFIEAKVNGRQTFPRNLSAVTLVVDIQEGSQYRIGQIFLQGNTRTDDDVVRNNLDLHTGDILNPELLLSTQRRIYQLGIFGSVNVEVLSKDPQARLANLIVKTQEKRNGTIDLGIEVGSAEGIILSAEVGHRNLFGTARSLRTRAEVAYRFEALREDAQELLNLNEYRIETAYREPWILNSQWAGTLNLSTERNRREKTYNLNANRVIVGADRELGERWRFLPRYSWEKDVFFPKVPSADCDINDARFDSGDPGYQLTPRPVRGDDPGRCDRNPDASPGLVGDIRSNVNLGTYYVAGLEPVLVGDYRNDRFAPTNGSLITYRLFYGIPALGSDFHFVRQDVSTGNFLELAKGWGLALGVRAGVIRLLPPTDELIKPQKYVLGGANSVRGFGLYEIFVPAGTGVESGEDGGLLMANYQAEFRFPLVWGLGGVLFNDAGQVWDSIGDIGFPILFSGGTGLRYETPIGPIRLDVGWKLNPGDVPCPGTSRSCEISPYEVHFAIGNAF